MVISGLFLAILIVVYNVGFIQGQRDELKRQKQRELEEAKEVERLYEEV